MTNLLKIAIGLGAALGAAALAISLSKKADEEEKVEFDDMDSWEDTDDLEKIDGVDSDKDADDDLGCCENCKSWNGEECVCEDNCGECYNMGGEEKKPSRDIKAAVNNIVDGVMGGLVVAADKVSELSSKLADLVAEKLDERKEAEAPDFSFEWDEGAKGASKEEPSAKDVAEDLGEMAEKAVDSAKDAAEDLAESIEDAASDIKDTID